MKPNRKVGTAVKRSLNPKKFIGKPSEKREPTLKKKGTIKKYVGQSWKRKKKKAEKLEDSFLRCCDFGTAEK